MTWCVEAGVSHNVLFFRQVLIPQSLAVPLHPVICDQLKA